jgi:hypothetical protein
MKWKKSANGYVLAGAGSDSHSVLHGVVYRNGIGQWCWEHRMPDSYVTILLGHTRYLKDAKRLLLATIAADILEAP